MEMRKLLCVYIFIACIAAYAKENGGSKDVSQSTLPEKPLNYTLDDFRNYYGSWAELSPKDSLIYCKNMGYKYVIYKDGMERYKEADGLRFLLVDP